MNKKTQEKKPIINRNEFLSLSWMASLFALFSQAGVGILRFLKPQIEPGAFGSKVTAGLVEEFQIGTVNHIQKGRFFITRLEDGAIMALWHRCTHLGCTIPWREEEGYFHCPCHSSIFNTVGEVLSGPAPRPMDLFPIEIVDGEIIVDTGKPIERNEFDPTQATYV